MSSFVIGNRLLLIFAQHSTLPLHSSDNPLNRHLKVLLLDVVGTETSSDQSGFVTNVGDIGSGESGSVSGELRDELVQGRIGIGNFLLLDRVHRFKVGFGFRRRSGIGGRR